MSWAWAIRTLVCALPLAACAPGAAVPVGERVRVELDAFSGRPNPGWELVPAEIAELRRRLRGLPEVGEAPASPDGLGYRGFLLRSPPDAPSPFARVVEGLVRVGADRESPVYRDVHDLEGWLREQARMRGHAPVPPG